MSEITTERIIYLKALGFHHGYDTPSFGGPEGARDERAKRYTLECLLEPFMKPKEEAVFDGTISGHSELLCCVLDNDNSFRMRNFLMTCQDGCYWDTVGGFTEPVMWTEVDMDRVKEEYKNEFNH